MYHLSAASFQFDKHERLISTLRSHYHTMHKIVLYLVMMLYHLF